MTLARRLDGPLGWLLAPLGWLYGGVAALRVMAYRRGWMSSLRPPLPTLSIGNLAVGGTGKTPLLFAALRYLAEQGAEVGVLSRGYGGDEGRMLGARFPEVGLVEDADRRRGLRTLLAQGTPDLLLLDDGMQHLRLQRDLDVVLIDATRPFGRCLPAGLFRESRRALRRADLVVLSRASLVDNSRREAIWQEIDRLMGKPQARIEGDVVARAIRPLDGSPPQAVDAWRGCKVGLAAGIGNPASFRALVEGLGMEVVAECPLQDHHPWDAALVAHLQGGGVRGFRGPWLVTEKDAVKIPQPCDQLHELRVEWEFLCGASTFHECLDALHLPVRAARIEPLWAAHDPSGREVR